MLSLIVVIAAALPHVVRYLVSKKLKTLSGFKGSIGRLDLNIARARMILYDFRLESDADLQTYKTSRISVHVPRMIMNFSWRSLCYQNLDATFYLNHVTLDVYDPPVRKPDNLEASYRQLREKLQLVFCFNVNATVEQSRLNFHTSVAGEVSVIELSNFTMQLADFSNDASRRPSARLALQADMFAGRLAVSVDLIPMALRPTFTAKLMLSDAKLSGLNLWLRHFLNFGVYRGDVSIQSELVADNGTIQGYVEPRISHAVVSGGKDRVRNIAGKIYDWSLNAVIKLVGKGQGHVISIRVPLNGTVDNISISKDRLMQQVLYKLLN